MAIYMEYDGIKGNVTATGYVGMIKLDFFVFGVQRAISMKTGELANRENTKPTFSVMMTGKKLDSASAGIFREAVGGSRGKQVKIHFVRSGQRQFQEFMTLTFQQCLPTLHQLVALSREGGVPVERLYLSYSAVEVSYIASGADNKTQTPQRSGYNLATAASV